MKFKLFTFAVTLLLVLMPLFAQEKSDFSLVIQTPDDLNNLPSVDSSRYENVHILFVGMDKIEQSDIGKLKSWPLLKKTNAASFYQCKFNNGVVRALFTYFNFLGVEYLSFEESEISQSPGGILKGLSSSIRTIRVVNMGLPGTIVSMMAPGNTPQLRHLELVDCKLGKEDVDTIRQWEIIPQLTYLDLSENSLGNYVFTLFQDLQESRIETLKLNGCDLKLEPTASYSKDQPALYPAEGSTDIVDWSGPAFSNLRWLEIQNPTTKPSNLTNLYKQEAIQRLDVFIGFYFKPWLESDEEIESAQNIVRNIASSYPLRSKKTPISFNSPAQATQFADRALGQYLEQIQLQGERWNRTAISVLLASNAFPQLRQVNLNQVNISDGELKGLIESFSDYQFEVVIHRGVSPNGKLTYFSHDYWPRMATEQK